MARDPLKYFRIEARELHERLAQGVLALERGEGAGEALAEVLRAAHTLKGAARVVKQVDIADASHALEDALAPVRAGEPATRPVIDALLALVDGIGRQVAALAPSPELTTPATAARAATAPAPATSAASVTTTATTATATTKVTTASTSEKTRAPVEEAVLRADVGDLDAVLDGLAEVHALVASARRGTTAVGRASRLADLLVEELAAPRSQGSGVTARTRSVASEVAALLGTLDRDVARGLEQVDREVRQVRDVAERLRLLPARLLLAAAERACRDAARALGKDVELEARGGSVRLDAQVLGPLQGAFVQLVRNAVAHGIEDAATRVAAGKPPTGRVTVEVVRRGRRVVLSCRDDGAGVDVAAVRRAAERQGLSEHGAGLGPAELLGLLLRGGISTATAVTAVSGRGVGMDVVRDAAKRVGGEVRVDTERGKGTLVEVEVPLTLSSLETLLVEVEGVGAAIPLDAVHTTVRLSPDQVVATTQGNAVLHEGALIPFVPLARPLFRMVVPARRDRPWSAVVLGTGASAAAVGVDRLRGTADIVVRSLPELSPADPVVFGLSLDAEGNPEVVVDPDALAAVARGARPEAEPEAPDRLPILVIDDSLTTRMLEQSILESAGYDVDVATSAEQGLEMAALRRYGLFLVDVEMPGMDGFTFIQTVKADPNLRDTPAILVTSRNAPEDKRRGEQVGAHDYVVKSEFDQGALLARIAGLMGTK